MGGGWCQWACGDRREPCHTSPHSVHKTEEELQAILAAKEEKLRLKAQRRDQQAQNVQRKRERQEAHKSVA